MRHCLGARSTLRKVFVAWRFGHSTGMAGAILKSAITCYQLQVKTGCSMPFLPGTNDPVSVFMRTAERRRWQKSRGETLGCGDHRQAGREAWVSAR